MRNAVVHEGPFNHYTRSHIDVKQALTLPEMRNAGNWLHSCIKVKNAYIGISK